MTFAPFSPGKRWIEIDLSPAPHGGEEMNSTTTAPRTKSRARRNGTRPEGQRHQPLRDNRAFTHNGKTLVNVQAAAKTAGISLRLLH